MATIHDAFLPISERLAVIQGENIPKESLAFYEYGQIVHQVAVNALKFPAIERLRLTEENLTVAAKIKATLEASLPKEILAIKRPFDPVFDWDKDKEEKNKNKKKSDAPKLPLEIFMLEEVEFYINWLVKMRDEYSELSKMELSPDIRPVVSLPEKFSISDFKEHFNSTLTPEQAVLFLHYLTDAKIIAEYNFSSMGKLTKFLFGKNEDNARKDFGNIASLKSKKDLLFLKSVLNNLIQQIDADLSRLKR